MELQVQELLKKIKDEGIAVAHKESQAIIAEAFTMSLTKEPTFSFKPRRLSLEA